MSRRSTTAMERIVGDAAVLGTEFTDALAHLAEVIDRSSALDPLTSEYISVALHASTARLNRAGIVAHVERALELGATSQAIMEVFQLISVLGMHSATLGVPILVEELARRGENIHAAEPNDAELAVRDRFIRSRGFWTDLQNDIARLSPAYLDAFVTFAGVSWSESATLPDKVKELILIAIDADISHRYRDGVAIHTANALRIGATTDEIASVLRLVSLSGVDGAALGLECLAELAQAESDVPRP